jgi:opacity protein-like surface antigen
VFSMYSPRYFVLAVLALIAVSTPFAMAQKALDHSEISLSVFGQFTSDVSGNGITDDPTNSVGGQAAFRHSYRWYLGYEGAYTYTRFAERYSGQPFSIQHNTHDFSGAYVVKTPASFLGFRPFATIGISVLDFSPTLNGGQNASWQGRAALNYSVGVNYALLSSHFGVRAQYRGLYYKAPDFGNPLYKTDASRTTSEPMIGLYVAF